MEVFGALGVSVAQLGAFVGIVLGAYGLLRLARRFGGKAPDLTSVMPPVPTREEIEAEEDDAYEAVLEAQGRGERLDDATEAKAARAVARQERREAQDQAFRCDRFRKPPVWIIVPVLAGYLWTDFAPAARADDSAAAKPPKNEGPASVALQGGAGITLTEAPTAITPLAVLSVEGPIVLADKPRARAFADVGLLAAPGEAVNVANVETFRAADVRLGAGVVVGRSEYGGQDLRTTILAEFGFASRLTTGEAVPADRLARRYGIGVRLEERKSGIGFTALFGRDEAGGDRGFGQLMVRGAVPIAGFALGGEDGGLRAGLALRGDATLSLGPKVATWLHQRDVLTFAVVATVGPRR